jgi:hypothetical protein
MVEWTYQAAWIIQQNEHIKEEKHVTKLSVEKA